MLETSSRIVWLEAIGAIMMILLGLQEVEDGEKTELFAEPDTHPGRPDGCFVRNSDIKPIFLNARSR
ncbi:hypothetical protein [Ruegeria sp. Alg231-54]|uniref:hypothetical protein n=1 Tax=Ruegeria sp. Alg231-54 TaxID=1922221 RepID=UPI000D54D376|nr:hypothetical protein [Ruegeria sp. Alg231-54]